MTVALLKTGKGDRVMLAVRLTEPDVPTMSFHSAIDFLNN